MELQTKGGFCQLSQRHYTIEHGPEAEAVSEDGIVSYVSDIKRMWETTSGRQVDPTMFAPYGRDEEFVLTITKEGNAAMVSTYNYPRRGRGGQGVVNVINGSQISSLTGRLCDEVVVTGDQGTMLRTHLRNIRRSGRNSPGIRLINLRKGEHVASASIVPGNWYVDDDESS